MSENEKKLLTALGVVGFLIINYLGYSFAMSTRRSVNAQNADAMQKLAVVDKFHESRDLITEDIDWLAQHEPQPTASQDVQTGLQQSIVTEAGSSGFGLTSQKLLPVIAKEGSHFHSAQFEIKATCTEEMLYRWFDKLNNPEVFRVVSQIRLSPNQKDDTQIDCTAVIEQWFVPKTL
jgi:hypothetical protein